MIVGEDRYAAGIFAEGNSGRSFTCSTMASSIARWPAISISCWSLPRMLAIACFPADDCVSRCRSLRRADAVVLTSGASPGVVSAGAEAGLAGAARHRAEKCSGPAGGFLRHRAAAEFRGATADCGHRTGGRGFLSRPSCLHRAGHSRSAATAGAQRRRTGSSPRKKTPSIWAGYLAALEPLAVVPVKMELADAANAVDTMLRRIAERRGAA